MSGEVHKSYMMACAFRAFRCHEKGATVQGAVSAASAVANAAVQAKEFPLPQTLLLQCPCSVRDQVASRLQHCVSARNLASAAVQLHVADMAEDQIPIAE